MVPGYMGRLLGLTRKHKTSPKNTWQWANALAYFSAVCDEEKKVLQRWHQFVRLHAAGGDGPQRHRLRRVVDDDGRHDESRIRDERGENLIKCCYRRSGQISHIVYS
jgi:hypothetical protein